MKNVNIYLTCAFQFDMLPIFFRLLYVVIVGAVWGAEV